MTVKQSINQLVAKNKEVVDFIERTFRKSDADAAIADYCNYLGQSGHDSSLSLHFADCLKSASNPELWEQFELTDIELLYDSFLELSRYILDIHIDAASFAADVLNDKQKARKIIESGMDVLKIQLSELQNLAKEIG